MYIPLKEQAKIQEFLTAIDAGEDVIINPDKIELLFNVLQSIFFALFSCWLYYQDTSASIIVILGIVVFSIGIPDFICLFTQDGLLKLNAKGITYFHYEQEKHYAWYHLDSADFSGRRLNYLYIRVKEDKKFKRVGCYSGKEISMIGLIKVINRKIQESANDKEL